MRFKHIILITLTFLIIGCDGSYQSNKDEMVTELKTYDDDTSSCSTIILVSGDGGMENRNTVWKSTDGENWNPESSPVFNTRAALASPDVVAAPDGTYRLYGMENGRPGIFVLYTSKDGRRWKRYGQVFKEPTAFNISVAVDPLGTWWAYFNRTDQDCIQRWGSKRSKPKTGQVTPILPN